MPFFQRSVDGQLSDWWHLTNVSPDHFTSSHLVLLFHMAKHFNDIGLQAFSGLNQWSKGPTEQNNLFWKAKQGEREKKQAMVGEDFENSDKRHMLGLFRDSLIILHFQQKQWWEQNISYLSKWQFANLMPMLCRPDILSSTLFPLISFFFW